jgi:hypothetical protein
MKTSWYFYSERYQHTRTKGEAEGLLISLVKHLLELIACIKGAGVNK